MGESLDPEDVRVLMGRYFEWGGDVDDLKRACDLLDASSAIADAALARLELFGLTHEAALLQEAQRTLSRIGDEEGLQGVARSHLPKD